ncbi:MAG: hypothetical protein WCK51_01590 [Armatimonadota bacterium]
MWAEVADWMAEFKGRQIPQTMEGFGEAWNPSRLIELPCQILHKHKGDVVTEQEFFGILTKQLIGIEPEPRFESYQKLWRLLSGLEFCWRQDDAYWKEVVSNSLSSLVPDSDKRKNLINLMLRRVQELSQQGDQIITSEDFFAQYELNLSAWFDWKNIITASQSALGRKLRTRRYLETADARRLANPHVDNETAGNPSPFVILKGPSGQGKSWELSSRAIAWSKKVPVLIEKASGSAVNMKTALEKRFASEVCGRTESLPFEAYPELIGRAHADHRDHWLTIAIDQVESADWIDDIYHLFDPIDGIRIIVASQDDPANQFLTGAPDNVAAYEVESFSDKELACLLTDGDLGRIYGMEPKLQETLRLPLLASLYKQVDSNEFRPESEYQLYDTYFKQFYKKLRSVDSAVVRTALFRASLAVARKEHYPWTVSDLTSFGLTPTLIQILVDSGFLVPTDQGKFEIWHDRILEWLLAEAKVDQLSRSEIQTEDFIDAWIFEFNHAPQHLNFSGYWLMDTLWILTSSPAAGRNLLSDLFAELETKIHNFQAFVENMLGTLGNKISATVLNRIQATEGNRHTLWRRSYVDFLAQFPIPEVEPFMLHNADSVNSEARVASYAYFKKASDTAAIEVLWARYLKVLADSGIGYDNRPDEKPDNYGESRDIFDTLYRCLPTSTDSILTKLASPQDHPRGVPLLLAVLRNIPSGKELWSCYKERLIEFLPVDERWQRARTAGAFKDSEELLWLCSVLKEEDFALPGEALKALVKIDEHMAIKSLQHCDPSKVYMSRREIIEPLCYLRHRETINEIERLMTSNPDRLVLYAQWFVDTPNLLSVRALELILDGLEAKLGGGDPNHVYRWMQVLEGISEPELLSAMAGRRGTLFDSELTRMLCSRTSVPSRFFDSARAASSNVLQKVSPQGVAKLANQWLRSKDRFVRMAAFDLIPFGYDSKTLEVIRVNIFDSKNGTDESHSIGGVQHALAIVQEWALLIESLLHRPSDSTQEIANFRLDKDPVADSELSEVLQIWEYDSKSRGAIMALGFAQRAEYADDIATILRSQPAEDPLFASCLWSLNMMPVMSPYASEILAEIAVNSGHWLAIRALEVAGDLESKRRLVSLIERAYKNPVNLPIGLDRVHTITSLTEHLLLIPEIAPAVQRLCIELVESGIERNVFARELVNSMGWFALGTPQFQFLFHNPDVIEYCRRIAFQADSRVRFVGNKRNAVRGLSITNPGLAFSATLHILQTESAHDRELAPFDLLRYDEARGIEALLAQFLCVSDEVFRTYIGVALAPHVDRLVLIQDLNHADEAVVKRAIFLLSLQGECEENLALLTPLIRHTSRDVAHDALVGVSKINRSMTAKRLVDKLALEQDRFRRYMMIDCLASTVFPELEYCGMPDLLDKVIQHEDYAIQNAMREKVKKRQKDLQRDLERKS